MKYINIDHYIIQSFLFLIKKTYYLISFIIINPKVLIIIDNYISYNK